MINTFFSQDTNGRLHLWLRKSSAASDAKLLYFKRKVLEALKASEAREKKEVRKALIDMEASYIEKAGYPIGTIREWKGRKFIKVAPGKWRPKYDSNTQGAKQSMRILRKKVAACTDAAQLMKLVEEHKQRFSDNEGKPYDWVKDLHDFAREQRYKILTAVNKDVEKRHAEARARNADERDFGHDYTEYKGKGQEAVDFIAKNGAGQVRGAFNRKDTGDIDVVWGKVTDAKAHKGYGIAHLIDKHGKDALKHVGEVIEKGKIIMSGVQRINIEKDGYVVGIRKDWKGHKKQWVVTSFQRNDGGNSSASAVTDYTKATSSQPSDDSVSQSGEKSSENEQKEPFHDIPFDSGVPRKSADYAIFGDLEADMWNASGRNGGREISRKVMKNIVAAGKLYADEFDKLPRNIKSQLEDTYYKEFDKEYDRIEHDYEKLDYASTFELYARRMTTMMGHYKQNKAEGNDEGAKQNIHNFAVIYGRVRAWLRLDELEFERKYPESSYF